MSARVGIVICNYNKRELVLSCIQAVLEQIYTDYDLYVVDNGSTDGSADAVTEKYGDRLTLLANVENLGGSGGFNTGLRKAYASGCEYLMCVDNDAFLDEHALGELVYFLDHHPECGMAASKIYHFEEPDFVQNFGSMIDYRHFATVVNDYNRYEDGSMKDFVYCDAVPACSVLVRASLIDRIGFLPEENFLYWDDTEWGIKCNLAGYKVASVGASKALHAMGARREVVNTFPMYYAWRNMLHFFIRYTPEDRIVDMAISFLSQIYEISFASCYQNVTKKLDTVMAAYDDAIHGRMGKALPGRIFDVDYPMKHYRKLFMATNRMAILDNGMPSLKAHIIELCGSMGYKNVVFVNDVNQADTILHLCRSFLYENADEIDRSVGKRHYFFDLEDCIVDVKEQPALVEQFKEGREVFYFNQLGLFLRQIKMLRREYKMKEER